MGNREGGWGKGGGEGVSSGEEEEGSRGGSEREVGVRTEWGSEGC